MRMVLTAMIVDTCHPAGAVGDNREGIVGELECHYSADQTVANDLGSFTGLRISILSADAILKGIGVRGSRSSGQ